MKAVFADTVYYLALLNERDEMHERALEVGGEIRSPIVTTEFVLLEMANMLSHPDKRGSMAIFLANLSADRETEVVECGHELLLKGLDLFLYRPDKEWSLTDCISFKVMRERRLMDALTHDHHFKQAGFRVLL